MKIKQISTGFHGHMVKTKNDLKSKIKLIDIIVEVLDARIPLSSSNKDIENLFETKPKIIVLNKADLADDETTKRWEKEFINRGNKVVIMSANVSSNVNRLIEKINELGQEIYSEKIEGKSIKINPIYRVAIVGIPNVGKSTLINKMAKRETAKVGNKPGVTTANKWIRIANNIDLLDTPGLLWPNLNENDSGAKLALTGNIKQEILDSEELACLGIAMMISNEKYRKILAEKYKLESINSEDESYTILEEIGKKRGCIMSGGRVDTERASKLFLDEFKNGKIGKISLEEC